VKRAREIHKQSIRCLKMFFFFVLLTSKSLSRSLSRVRAPPLSLSPHTPTFARLFFSSCLPISYYILGVSQGSVGPNECRDSYFFL
jgi:hypothetical protein